MRNRALKNRTAFGSKLKDMNDNTYALRRKVMTVIYKAKNKGFDLPRVEVRVVKDTKGACAYAYRGKCIVHVDEKYLSPKYDWMLTRLILHELGHAIFGLSRVIGCRLMDCKMRWDESFEDKEAWELFAKYYKGYKKV